MKKRLFIFAAYAPKDRVEYTLIYYLQVLSKLGDIVLVFDSDLYDYDREFLKSEVPGIVHIETKRHNEYDFGSYKRGYVWAKSRLRKYDWVYFVNDSVLCLKNDLSPIFNRLECLGTDATGLFAAQNHHVRQVVVPEHIQSWFIGIKSGIADTDYIRDFVLSIEKQPVKSMIIWAYEIGFSNVLREHGVAFKTLSCGDEKVTPNLYPLFMLKNSIPFIKKTALRFIPYRKIRKYADKESIDTLIEYVITNNYWFNNQYTKLWEIRLLGFIPFISKYRRFNINKEKILLFRIIPIYSKYING